MIKMIAVSRVNRLRSRRRRARPHRVGSLLLSTRMPLVNDMPFYNIRNGRALHPHDFHFGSAIYMMCLATVETEYGLVCYAWLFAIFAS